MISILPILAATLFWHHDPHRDLAWFNVYSGRSPGVYDRTNTTAETNFTFATLPPGTNYFAVSAVSIDGQELISDELRTEGMIVVHIEEACDVSGPWETLTNWIAPGPRFYRLRVEAK